MIKKLKIFLHQDLLQNILIQIIIFKIKIKIILIIKAQV